MPGSGAVEYGILRYSLTLGFFPPDGKCGGLCFAWWMHQSQVVVSWELNPRSDIRF